MVTVASSTRWTPWAPPTRRAMLEASSVPRSLPASMGQASTVATTTWTMVQLVPSTRITPHSAMRAVSVRLPASWVTSPSTASLQVPWKSRPTSGSSRIQVGGEGRFQASGRENHSATWRRLGRRAKPMSAMGTTTSTRRTSTESVAASGGWPPVRSRNHRCSGHTVTDMKTDQRRMVPNGARMVKVVARSAATSASASPRSNIPRPPWGGAGASTGTPYPPARRLRNAPGIVRAWPAPETAPPTSSVPPPPS